MPTANVYKLNVRGMNLKFKKILTIFDFSSAGIYLSLLALHSATCNKHCLSDDPAGISAHDGQRRKKIGLHPVAS